MSKIVRHPVYNTEAQIQRLTQIAYGGEGPEIGYMARLLLHSAFPHSATDARVTERVNGNLHVTIQAGPRHKLPYGSYPRLILAWIMTEANRTKRRELVLGSTLSEFMEQLGLIPTGGRWGTITQLREQMNRLLQARIVAEVSDERRDAGRTMEISTDWDLWWTPQESGQGGEWESTIRLGERFFEEITRRPFPVDLRILKAVKRSPLGIDLYTWLTYRVSYLKEPTHISWRQLHEQFGADYSGEQGVWEFTRAVKRELVKIKAAWPALTYETPRGRLKLHPCPPSVRPRLLPSGSGA